MVNRIERVRHEVEFLFNHEWTLRDTNKKIEGGLDFFRQVADERSWWSGFCGAVHNFLAGLGLAGAGVAKHGGDVVVVALHEFLFYASDFQDDGVGFDSGVNLRY